MGDLGAKTLVFFFVISVRQTNIDTNPNWLDMENQVNDPSTENKTDEGALEKQTETPAKEEKTDSNAESTALLEQIGKASL